MRAEFLAMVSHELRAPLTSIKGSTATVLGASSPLHPAEMRQFFRIVDEQADLMRGLISELLDAGRIETGTLSVTPEPVAVAGLVDQARNTFLSGGGRHAVRIDLPLDLPRVMADRERIVQVLNGAARQRPPAQLGPPGRRSETAEPSRPRCPPAVARYASTASSARWCAGTSWRLPPFSCSRSHPRVPCRK